MPNKNLLGMIGKVYFALLVKGVIFSHISLKMLVCGFRGKLYTTYHKNGTPQMYQWMLGTPNSCMYSSRKVTACISCMHVINLFKILLYF